MAAKLTYAIVGAGVDLDGWYKVRLLRSDGREVKANKKRVADLRREGRIVEAAATVSVQEAIRGDDTKHPDVGSAEVVG